MHGFFDRLNNTDAYSGLADDTRGKKFTAAFGVQSGEKPFVAESVENFTLYVSSDYVDSQRVLRTMNSLSGGEYKFLPYKDDVLLYKRAASKNSVAERNNALAKLLRGKIRGVVTTIEALMQPLPSVKRFFEDCISLKTNNDYDTVSLSVSLVNAGYERVEGIEKAGQFTLRGDILDVCVESGKRYRADFFGDTLESLREIKADMTNGGKLESLEIFPVYDAASRPNLTDKVASYIGSLKATGDRAQRLSSILSELYLSDASGAGDNGWLMPFTETSCLFQYLPQNTTIIWDEPKRIEERVNFLYGEHDRRLAALIGAGEATPLHSAALADRFTLFSSYGAFGQLSLQTLPYKNTFFRPEIIREFKTTATSNYLKAFDILVKDIKNWKLQGYETVILAGGEDGVNTVTERLHEAGIYMLAGERLEKGAADGLVLNIAVEKGFVSHTNKLAVIGTRDIGRNMSASVSGKSNKQTFLSIEKGDFVVHDVHGIGLCEGIEKVTNADGEVKEYVAVLYKRGDKLYVPVENSNLLTRYAGGGNPVLSQIGGREFEKVKAQVKSGIKEMSVNLLKLYAEREKERGFVYKSDRYLDEEFAEAFPYAETADQLKSLEEINSDMSRNKIMDRILVGDVGYGKTEVAMRAAFRAVYNGYQVAVMAPTTILSEQHLKTFTERMERFDVKVMCINRFRSAEEQRKILESVKNGKTDILIGTHRLLSKDVEYQNLGLLILDEEQRFGVEHKELVKTTAKKVDVLTLSATPIPRTLHMALSGIRDISTITTPPSDRLAVETFVVETSDAMLRDIIMREISRGGQVFFVYNRVESIDVFAAKIAALVPEAKIATAHGRMDENLLEDTVYAFSQGKFNVLLCTTIIENGIDMPNANTLIVYDSDRFGLSQLYQLRGRVGRSNRLAYAYFVYRADKILTEIAYKRLSSVTEYSELGSGFKIAMKDLEIRGAGNILGREQHGHMMRVGYDMYARLLKETVLELKGQRAEKTKTAELEISVEAYAPDEYIQSSGERMEFYQELAAINDTKTLRKYFLNIEDAYGTMPVTAVNLFRIQGIKILAINAGVSKVSVKAVRAELFFADKHALMRKPVFDAVSFAGGRATVSAVNCSVVLSSPDFMQKERLLTAVEEFLSAARAR